MVVEEGALVAEIVGIAALPFLAGFSATVRVVAGSLAAGRHTSCLDRRQSLGSRSS